MTDRLHNQLFAVEGKELVNIKFLVGNGADISVSDFRDAVATKIFEIDNKLMETKKDFGDREQTTTDVGEIVGRMKHPSN